MLVYNIVFGINFLLGLINIQLKKKKPILIFLSFIFLSLFLCLNYTNGIDWTQYQNNFLQILPLNEILESRNYYANIPERNREEIIFYYLMSFAKMLGLNYEIYQYIVLSIVLYIIYDFISKCSEYPLVALLIYFCDFMLGNFFEPAFRQLIVIAIFYLGIVDIKNKKILNYFIKILIASLFHSSALVLIFCYFIPRKKIKISIVIVIFVITLLISNHIKLFLNILNNFLPFIEKYMIYFKIEEYGLENSINIIFFIKIIISILIGAYVEKNNKYLLFKNKNFFYLILNLYWINEITFILKRQMIIFFRLQYYFLIFNIIIITFLIKILLKKYGKKVGIIIFLVYSIIYYRIMHGSIIYWQEKDPMKFYPYTNYILEITFNEDIKEEYSKINYRLSRVKNKKIKN